MSTPPIAKEPEVTGLSEVREKLEEARHLIQSGGIGEKAMLAMRHGAIAKITEALALMESEQEYDPWDHRKRCDVTEDPSGIGMSCQLPKGHTCDHVWFGYAKSGVDGSPERWTILGTESENGADDE